MNWESLLTRQCLEGRYVAGFDTLFTWYVVRICPSKQCWVGGMDPENRCNMEGMMYDVSEVII